MNTSITSTSDDRRFNGALVRKSLVARRPSVLEEMEQERIIFGQGCLDVMEPRPMVMWCGVTEVLEGER